jgi:hypothetical protein
MRRGFRRGERNTSPPCGARRWPSPIQRRQRRRRQPGPASATNHSRLGVSSNRPRYRGVAALVRAVSASAQHAGQQMQVFDEVSDVAVRPRWRQSRVTALEAQRCLPDHGGGVRSALLVSVAAPSNYRSPGISDSRIFGGEQAQGSGSQKMLAGHRRPTVVPKGERELACGACPTTLAMKPGQSTACTALWSSTAGSDSETGTATVRMPLS